VADGITEEFEAQRPRLPGRAFAALRRGGHLAPEHTTGTVTFDEFLAVRFPSGRPR
jgi:hypothetical protein